MWTAQSASRSEEGKPTLRSFDFEAACANRELRNAALEIYDLFWDWQGPTRATADQLDGFMARLNDALVARGIADSP
ncbi:MAG: hypothetical protein ACQET0_09660 [Pseudomonadota bacterium]